MCIFHHDTSISRRGLIKGAGSLAAATAFAGGLARPAFAVPETIKLGLVMPQTGPLAFFSEHVSFILDQVKKATGGQLDIGGTKVPFEVILKDSQSNPNRASEVASELILNDGIHVMMAAATPETTVPVSDQCELNGVPCVTNDTPVEPYFFGRKGDPAKGFQWTNHYFFAGQQSGGTLLKIFDQVESSRVIGALWPNDGDGNAFAQIYPPVFEQMKFGLSDPGRFDMPLASYAAAVSKFKADNVDLVFGVIPPPEFTTFWNEAAQQKFQPKIVYAGKTFEFPAAIEAFGPRAENFVTEVWWAPVYPYSSTLTGQTSRELADEWEKTSGKQWSMPLGFRHSLFEVVFDGLKRAQNLDDPKSIQDAFNATDLTTICGPINFSKGPFPNTCTTPTAGGQWIKGGKYALDLRIVENSFAPDVKVEGKAEPMRY